MQMYVFDDEAEKTVTHYEYPSPLVRCSIQDELYEHSGGSTRSIVAVLSTTTFVYNLKDGTLYDQYATYSNPRGQSRVFL